MNETLNHHPQQVEYTTRWQPDSGREDKMGGGGLPPSPPLSIHQSCMALCRRVNENDHTTEWEFPTAPATVYLVQVKILDVTLQSGGV